MTLTKSQKLDAFALKYYQHHKWVPEVGHYYTTTRNDLELYLIVDITDEIITIRYVAGDAHEDFPLDGFTDEGFGLCRLWVPEHILKSKGHI